MKTAAIIIVYLAMVVAGVLFGFNVARLLCPLSEPTPVLSPGLTTYADHYERFMCMSDADFEAACASGIRLQDDIEGRALQSAIIWQSLRGKLDGSPIVDYAVMTDEQLNAEYDRLSDGHVEDPYSITPNYDDMTQEKLRCLRELIWRGQQQ